MAQMVGAHNLPRSQVVILLSKSTSNGPIFSPEIRSPRHKPLGRSRDPSHEAQTLWGMSASPLKAVAALAAAKTDHKRFEQELADLLEGGDVSESMAALMRVNAEEVMEQARRDFQEFASELIPSGGGGSAHGQSPKNEISTCVLAWPQKVSPWPERSPSGLTHPLAFSPVRSLPLASLFLEMSLSLPSVQRVQPRVATAPGHL
jgi:hypothetical protein